MATRRTPQAAAPAEARRLTDAELAEMMRLVKGADTVELKVTIPADAHVATIRGLDIDPVEAQPRQAFFFDTPDLALNRAGVVVRARRIQGGRADTVVKLRPVDPTQLPKALRRDPSFNVEVDALPGGFVCSASFKGRATGDQVRDAVRGRTPLSRIFSKGQRAFFRERAPEGVELDALVPLGPTFILKTRLQMRLGVGKAADRQLVAELWLYPDGSRILELSTKCLPAETFQVAAEARAYLAERGIDLSGVQQTKTRTALEFHAGQLPAPSTALRAPAGDGTNGAGANGNGAAAPGSSGARPRSRSRAKRADGNAPVAEPGPAS
jgi:hypothetical protein